MEMRLMMAGCAAAVAACLCGCAAPAGKAGTPGEAAKAAPALPGTKPTGEVLAKIGDMVITDKDLDEKIKAMPPRVVGRFQSPAGKRNLLNSMVELELIYREAEKEGLDRDKETVERIAEFKKRLAAEKLREKVLNAVKVDKDEIRKEYEKEGDRYKTQKQVKVSQIVFTWDKSAPPKKVEAAKKDAADILARAKKSEDFAELAKKYSLDQASASKGGDIGYATRRALSPEAYKIAMDMEKTGEISGLIEGKDEVRILKATEVIPEKKKPLEEVSPWLERVVQSRKQREAWLAYLSDLKKREGVVVYEDKLGTAEKGAEGELNDPAGMRDPRIPASMPPQGAPMQIKLGPGQLNAPAVPGRMPQGDPIRIVPSSAPPSGAM
jgi:parvulin-like peptidyl-prolyl isomerase